MNEDVTVIGAGVSGLTTAVRLLESGLSVRIVADRLPTETTSAVAGAIWFPYEAYPLEKVKAWSAFSYRVFEVLASVKSTGVEMIDLFELFRHDVGEPWWADAVPAYRKALPEETPAPYEDGYVIQVPLMDSVRYLPYLVSRIETLGGDLEELVEPIESFDELDTPIVVNCAGLGASRLCRDDELYPIRGQVVRTTNPGIEVSFADDAAPEKLAYVIPRSDGCVLGGSAVKGNDSLDVDPNETKEILKRCSAFAPQLAGAQVLDVRVGLRPGRKTVRLDSEMTQDGRRIVHNYGHGGSGFTLSWGCAAEVVNLVQQ